MKLKTNKSKLNAITKKTKIRKIGSNYTTSIPVLIAELYNINSENQLIWHYDPNSNELTLELR